MCLTKRLPARAQAHGQVDPDGSRYLLGDIAGNLLLLVRGCACPADWDQKGALLKAAWKQGAVQHPS